MSEQALLTNTSERSFDEYDNQPAINFKPAESSNPFKFNAASEATVELDFYTSPMGHVARWIATNELKQLGGAHMKELSAEEANARFPDALSPFTAPIHPAVAQMQYDRQMYEQQLNQTIEAGPQDNWSKFKRFGLGQAVFFSDPVAVAATITGGLVVGGVAKGIGFVAAKAGLQAPKIAVSAAAKLAAGQAAVKAGTAGIGTRLAVGGVEGVASNLPFAVGFQAESGYLVEAEGGRELTFAENNQEILMNTLMGTVFHVGIGEAGFQTRGLTEKIKAKAKTIFEKTSPEAEIPIVQAAAGNLMEDVMPNTEVHVRNLLKETDVRPQDLDLNATPYEYAPGNKGQSFFISTKENVAMIHEGTPLPLGDNYGINYFGEAPQKKSRAQTKRGQMEAAKKQAAVNEKYDLGSTVVEASDNPARVEATSARAASDSTGSVHEVKINAKPHEELHTSSLLPDELVKSVKENYPDMLDEDIAKMTVHDLLTKIQEGVESGELNPKSMQQVADDITRAGYKVLVSDGATFMGEPQQKHNHMIILDKSVVEQVGNKDARVGSTRPVEADVLAKAKTQLTAKENKLAFSQDRKTKYEEAQKTTQEILSKKQEPLREEAAMIIEEFKETEKIDLISQEARDLIDLDTKADFIDRFARSLATCGEFR